MTATHIFSHCPSRREELNLERMPELHEALADVMQDSCTLEVQLPTRSELFTATRKSLLSRGGRSFLREVDDLALLESIGIDVPCVSRSEADLPLMKVGQALNLGQKLLHQLSRDEAVRKEWELYDVRRKHCRQPVTMIPAAVLNRLIDEHAGIVLLPLLKEKLSQAGVDIPWKKLNDICFHRKEALGKGRYEEIFRTRKPIVRMHPFRTHAGSSEPLPGLSVHDAATLARELLEQQYNKGMWMPAGEAASVLGIDTAAVRRHFRKGSLASRVTLPGSRVACYKRCEVEALHKLLEHQRQSGVVDVDVRAGWSAEEGAVSTGPESWIIRETARYLAMSVEDRISERAGSGKSIRDWWKELTPSPVCEPQSLAQAARVWNVPTGSMERLLMSPETRELLGVQPHGRQLLIPAAAFNAINIRQNRLIPGHVAYHALREAGLEFSESLFRRMLRHPSEHLGAERVMSLFGPVDTLIVDDLAGRPCVDRQVFAILAAELHYQMHIKKTWDDLATFGQKIKRKEGYCRQLAREGKVECRWLIGRHLYFAPQEARRLLVNESLEAGRRDFLPSSLYPDLTGWIAESLAVHPDGKGYGATQVLAALIRGQRVSGPISLRAAYSIWGVNSAGLKSPLLDEAVIKKWGIERKNHLWLIPPGKVNSVNALLKISIPLSEALRCLHKAGLVISGKELGELVHHPSRYFRMKSRENGATRTSLAIPDPLLRRVASGQIMERILLKDFLSIARYLRRKNSPGEETGGKGKKRERGVREGESEDPVRMLADPVAALGARARRHPVLNQDEELQLFHKMRIGSFQEAIQAREALVEHNLRLVLSIAAHFQGRGLSMADLVNEGLLGLMKAIDMFSLEKTNAKTGTPFKLSTYADYWIKVFIRRAVKNTAHVIRIPVHQYERRFDLLRCKESLTAKLGREVSYKEVSEIAGIDEKEVEDLLTSLDVISLDQPAEEGGRSLAETEVVSIDAARDYAGTDTTDRVAEAFAISSLTAREKDVLKLRFGLDEGGHARTLEEVGHIFELTRERIRQIEAKALAKVRKNARCVALLEGII